jgi:hypothetical protein
MNATATVTDRPLAAPGLTSYRYAGRYGWLMIGAKDNADALREANRSASVKGAATLENLEVWDGTRYVPVAVPVAVPPVLDEAADPVGYNADKLRALAGSLATQRGKMGAGKAVLRAVDACLATLRDGCDPAKATRWIGSARHALKTQWGVTAAGLRGLEALERAVRAVPQGWHAGKPATLAGAAQRIARDWCAAARLGISAPPGVYVADVQRLLADGSREAWSLWTDGKALLFTAALPKLAGAVTAQPAGPGMTASIAEMRERLRRATPGSPKVAYGSLWSDTEPGALVRDGAAVAFFAAHNVAILKAHGGTVWGLVSNHDLRGTGGHARTVLAAWDAKGELVGFAMPISLAGAAVVAAADAAGAVWGAP